MIRFWELSTKNLPDLIIPLTRVFNDIEPPVVCLVCLPDGENKLEKNQSCAFQFLNNLLKFLSKADLYTFKFERIFIYLSIFEKE
jgi:hypothetical protein